MMNNSDGMESIDQIRNNLKAFCAVETAEILDKEEWVEYSLSNIINSLPQKINLVKLQMKDRLNGENVAKAKKQNKL